MAKPQSKAEARFFTSYRELKYIYHSAGYQRFLKRGMSRARRRSNRKIVED